MKKIQENFIYFDVVAFKIIFCGSTTVLASGAVTSFTRVQPIVTTLMQNKGVSTAVNSGIVVAIGMIGKKIAGFLGLYQDSYSHVLSDQLKDYKVFENIDMTNATAFAERIKELMSDLTGCQADNTGLQKDTLYTTKNKLRKETR